MKNKKLLSLAVLSAAAIGLASCGASTISGTYENIASQERIVELSEAGEGDIFNAWWSMAVLFYTDYGVSEYEMGSKIEFSADGTYTYTKLGQICTTWTWDYDWENPVFEACELVYTGTYTAGEGNDSYVLGYPSDCEWSYNAGMFASLGGVSAIGQKYSEGATAINPFGDMGGGEYDVMTSFDHELIVFESGTLESTATLTVTLGDNNTFSF